MSRLVGTPRTFASQAGLDCRHLGTLWLAAARRSWHLPRSLGRKPAVLWLGTSNYHSNKPSHGNTGNVQKSMKPFHFQISVTRSKCNWTNSINVWWTHVHIRARFPIKMVLSKKWFLLQFFLSEVSHHDPSAPRPSCLNQWCQTGSLLGPKAPPFDEAHACKSSRLATRPCWSCWMREDPHTRSQLPGVTITSFATIELDHHHINIIKNIEKWWKMGDANPNPAPTVLEHLTLIVLQISQNSLLSIVPLPWSLTWQSTRKAMSSACFPKNCRTVLCIWPIYVHSTCYE